MSPVRRYVCHREIERERNVLRESVRWGSFDKMSQSVSGNDVTQCVHVKKGGGGYFSISVL